MTYTEVTVKYVRQELKRISAQLVFQSKEMNGGELDLLRLQFMYQDLKDMEYLVLHCQSLILEGESGGDSESTQRL